MGENHTSDKRIWLGGLFILIGSVWLLDNLDIIPYYYSRYLFNWKTFLIALGTYFIFGRKKPEPGIIMIAIGGVFLLEEFYYFDFRDILRVFWPVVIIVIGVSLILRRNKKSKWDAEKKNDLDYIDDFAIFGGRERVVDSQNFKGGKITALFGGSEISLTNAQLAEGVNELDVFVMFGGTEIRVPADWSVRVEVFSILGGFTDKRKSSVQVVPNPDKVLIVKGFVMFGGGEVKFSR
ncbi:hypothetical protein FNH22_00830 [Fulvivirga sp. M361]|uniref:LiaF transmembrane domain-containing protein n=1 Tax=Fulvivirga sp. M361 TaxID=2594266 RepID=UPI001179B4AC|nr:DUF5668 domain-containing protein [Fulvivirga sp. M361]TRX62671.1 hypothetical protein FNH22_00830 [Fulvivirga sp. M361]